MNAYWPGQAVVMQAHFEISDVDSDPTAFVFKIKDPAGTVTTLALSDCTKTGTGTYTYSQKCSVEGVWTYGITDSTTVEAAGQNKFRILDSAFN